MKAVSWHQRIVEKHPCGSNVNERTAKRPAKIQAFPENKKLPSKGTKLSEKPRTEHVA